MQEGAKERKKEGVGIRDKIPDYLEKMEKENEHYDETFKKVESDFMEQMQQQIGICIERSKQQFFKHKKSVEKELTTLKYYA
jgi:transposase